VLTGLAHTAICVPEVDAAVEWYESVLGMRVLSPPYVMQGEAMDRDMGELLPVAVVKAAIVGFERSDHVIELIEYPAARGREARRDGRVNDEGLTHVGIVCDDVEVTRAELATRGVAFLTSEVADMGDAAGLRTTWFRDPWGVIFILLEKGRADRPYWRQMA
jgi:catechol 2,3-dioxygenase-like lactoylglutathione lyase family enzyme